MGWLAAESLARRDGSGGASPAPTKAQHDGAMGTRWWETGLGFEAS
jgi:hypothetical protein